MSGLVTTRKARKPHRCERCGGLIQPGELYDDARLPPGGDMDNEGWWRVKSHVGAYLR